MIPTQIALALLVGALVLPPQDRAGSPRPQGGSPSGSAGGTAGGAQRAGGRGTVKPEAKTEEGRLGELALEYFRTADYNADTWIVYLEAHKSLGLDRPGFRVYDKDVDQRIDEKEFVARFRAILASGGAFPPPVKQSSRATPKKRTPEEFLREFETDGDDALGVEEIRKVIPAYGARELAAETLLAKFDRDHSRKLEGKEVDALLEALSPAPAGRSQKKAQSILELFGKREPRPDGTPGPDVIQGPIDCFRRLDYDGDGLIDARDLNALQRPSQLSIRINAVIATLDKNSDGAIDEAEFSASMRH